MANVFVGFFIIRKTFISPTLPEHIFFCFLRACVCVVSIFFVLFQFYLLLFRDIWGFSTKNIPLLSFCRIATAVITTDCYQRSLWMLFASVCRSVGWSVGWMTGCVFVFVCACVCVFFFYLFIEFNSFTVGCWQTHFQIANNVQFSRFITFCGNKTNWIICALLCFERISVFTYIHMACMYVCAAVSIGFLVPHSLCPSNPFYATE